MSPEERERSERIDRRLEFIANNQAQLAAYQVRLSKGADDQLKRLAEAEVRTDARLNTLIGVIERYLSNGRH